MGILCGLKEGCSWRALAMDTLSWQTIYGHFRRWSRSGVWDELLRRMPWKTEGKLCLINATHIKIHRD